MSTIAQELKKLPQIPYQKVAQKFNTSVIYVGSIARGERVPVRGKGLKIREYLKELILVKDTRSFTKSSKLDDKSIFNNYKLVFSL